MRTGDASLGPGDVIAGKYEVLQILGQGGMGVVVAAVHRRIEQYFAIKLLRPEHAARPDLIARFEREARAAGALRSAHAVRVFDVDATADGAPYIVMELLEGRDLSQEAAERGDIPSSELIDWIIQACDAIEEAHTLGIVHRDLKPSNIFLAKEGGGRIAKVVDFGISKLTGATEITGSNQGVLGTPQYVSPEQIDGKEVDGRADVRSLGVILYRLLSKRFPFAEGPGGLAEAMRMPPVGLDIHRPDLPADLVCAIMRTLERSPDDRFVTAAALAAALAPFGRGHKPLPRRADVRASLASQRDLEAAMESDATQPSPAVERDRKDRLLLELGRGGAGTVYLALAKGPSGFNKLKVVKQLRPDLAAEPQFLQMFREEARLAAQLNHPNVVQTFEVKSDGRCSIEMEYLDGQSLDALARRFRRHDKPPPRALSVWVVTQVLAGLHYAHELRDMKGKRLDVVHRDVSPHNVFVTYEGGVKVLDFGIAKAADSSVETRTGFVKGKATYMAPEQSMRGRVDRRADLFAVGVVLWELLTGRRFWEEMSDGEIFIKLGAGQFESPRSVVPDLPDELDAICMRALAKDPDARFATAGEMQVALEDWLAGCGVRVGPRQLAALLGELFAERRAAVRAEIQSHIERSGSEPPPTLVDVPVASPDRDTTQPTSGGAIARGEAAALAAKSSRRIALDDARTTRADGRASRTSLESEPPEPTRTAQAMTSEVPAKQPWRLRTVGLLAASAAALLMGGVLWWRPSHATMALRSPAVAGGAAQSIDGDIVAPGRACLVPSTCAAGSVCRAGDGACVPLATTECKVLAEPDDLTNPRTIWLGALLAWKGGDGEILENINALDLARQDFAHKAPTYQPGSSSNPRTPIAVVLCDDQEESERAAQHLIEDVGVPAVLGFANSGKEILDLVSGIFDRHDVLAVPTRHTAAYDRGSGKSVLIWRVAPLGIERSMKDFFEGVLEPYRRAQLRPRRPLRVALVRTSSAYGSIWGSSMMKGLRFNGKSAAENGDLFCEIVVPAPNDGTMATLRESISLLASCVPDIVLYQTCLGGFCGRILPEVERTWRASGPRPLYLRGGSPLQDDLESFLADDAERRRRFFFVDVVASTEPNLKLAAEYNAAFHASMTPAGTPSGAYDAFYLLAYAAYAAGDGPLDGAKLRAGIARLVPPGLPIDVGPGDIYDAFATLGKGRNIDLNGAGTPLDFDLSNGETAADWALYCATKNPKGKVDSVESGVTLTRKGAIEGSMSSCK